jgi:hypothetical protein
VAKKPTKSRNMSVYSNLTHKRKTKKDAQSRKKAEYLASLPKHPVKRLIYRLHPKRFFGYWFSKQGGIMALKVAGVAILLVVLTVGALFAYYRKDLDQIQPGELAKRVQTTVTNLPSSMIPVVKRRASNAYELLDSTIGRPSNKSRASSKAIPCLSKFDHRLSSSHSNSKRRASLKCSYKL